MPPEFISYEAFVSHLADREYFGQKLGLERIQSLLERLGNPHHRFRSIHIAGTNGKGSTAAMTASILSEAGYRVGLYTSPHLVDFCERIQIITHPRPLSYIKRGEVLRYARMIHEVEDPKDPFTFFELATAIGFLYFTEEKVDIAVIEVGLGGRLDATNVINPLVSVITTIGYDHTQHLGNTLEKIAFEKAGIIKPGVPVIVGDLPEEAMRIVETVAANERVLPLLTPIRRHRPATRDCWRSMGDPQSGHPFVSQFPSPLGGRGVRGEGELGLPGSHQRHNAAVAVAVMDELRRQNWSISEEAIQSGLANVRWPGRLETVQENPWILLDGAHNPQAMTVVREYLEENLQGRQLKVLFGAMGDKDIGGMLERLASITDQFFLVAPSTKRAASTDQLAQVTSRLKKEAKIFESIPDALIEITSNLRSTDLLLVTGSFYVVGEARRWFGRS